MAELFAPYEEQEIQHPLYGPLKVPVTPQAAAQPMAVPETTFNEPMVEYDDPYYGRVSIPASSAAALSKYRNPPAPPEEKGVTMADYAKSTMAGGANVVASLGWLARKAGAEDIGTVIQDLGNDAVDYWMNGLSDAARTELAKEFVVQDENGDYRWGDASMSTVGLLGAQSLLGTGAGMGAGAGLTKVLQVFANPAGRKVLQETVKKGFGTGASVAEQQAATAALRKLKTVDSILGAAGFGAGEGVIAGMAAGEGVESEIMGMTHEKLMEMDRYRTAYESMDTMGLNEAQRQEYAKEMVAEDAGMQAGWRTLTTTAVLGAPTGAFFGKLMGEQAMNVMSASRIRNMVTGMAGEAAQEAVQSGAEQAIRNVELERPVSEGVVSAAVGGAAAGGLLGGVAGGAAGGTAAAKKKPAQTGGTADTTGRIQAAADEAVARGIPQEMVDAILGDTEMRGIRKIRELKGLEYTEPEQVPVTEQPELPLAAEAPAAAIDAAAAVAATSPENDLPEPTEAQKEAGNYRKGHIRLKGLDISIENPAGSERTGTTEDGEPYSNTLANHYGYIRGTQGADGDQVDVFLGTFVGEDEQSDQVFVVDQLTEDGDFDEHKVMMGFGSAEEAEQAYLSNYSEGWDRYSGVTPMSVDDFKTWLREGSTAEPLSQLLYSRTAEEVIAGNAAGSNEFRLRHAAAERSARRGQLTDTAQESVISKAEGAGFDPVPFASRAAEQQKRYPRSEGWAPLEQVESVDLNSKGDAQVNWKPIPYSFHVEPSTGKANKKTEAVRVKRLANKMVSEVRNIQKRAEQGDKNAQVIMRQTSWYGAMRERLRGEFGGAADAVADLLGATSPQTNVRQNWDQTMEIVRQMSEGKVEAPLKKFLDHIDAGGRASNYKGPLVVQVNGKPYGFKSPFVMNALANLWRRIEPGMAPKARNFSMNLIGASDAATIDVWAARMLQRLSGGKRIPPLAEGSVKGVFDAKGEKPTGMFGFGQAVFEEAGNQLGMAPHELQAVSWFIEKEIWGQNRWTNQEGEGGSFEEQADLAKLSRFVVGLSIQKDAPPRSSEVVKVARELRSEVSKDTEAVAFRSAATTGLYAGNEEVAFDFEVTAKPGFNINRLIRSAVKVAREHSQYDTFVSRVLGPNERSDNARPGLEVYLTPGATRETLQPVIDQLNGAGLDGLTFVVDPRADLSGKEGQYVGIRIQYMPEFVARWDETFRNDMRTPGALDAAYERAESTFDAVQDAVAQMPEVVASRRVDYDTLVVGQEFYDEVLGRKAGIPNQAAQESWFPSSRSESYGRAVAGYEGWGTGGAADVPGGLGGPETYASRAVLPPGQQQSPKRNRAHTDRIASALKRAIDEVAPFVKVHVVHRIQDLPFRSRGIDLTTEAVFNKRTGEVYLIGKNLSSVTRAQEVFLHEVFGHAAMEDLPGFAEVLAAVQSQVEARAPDYLPYIRQVEASQPGLDVEIKAKEVIAVMAERGVDNRLINSLVAKVRGFLRRMGFNLRMTNREVRALIATGARRWRDGPVRAPETQMTTIQELNLAYSRARAAGAEMSDQQLDDILRLQRSGRTFVARISPEVFLKLTTANDEDMNGIINEPSPGYHSITKFDNAKFQQDESPWLKIEDGVVTGHEGRHRSAALLREGVASIPVVISTGPFETELPSTIEPQRYSHSERKDYRAPMPGAIEATRENLPAMRALVGPSSGQDVSVEHTPAERRFWGEIRDSQADLEELIEEVPSAFIEPDGTLHIQPGDLDALDAYLHDQAIRVENRYNPEGLLFSKRARLSDRFENIAADVMDTSLEDLTIRDRFDRLKQRWNLWDKGSIRQGIIDAGYAIERMERTLTGGNLLDAMDSAYKAYTATKNLPSVMAAVFRLGAPKYQDGILQAVPGRKGLEEIFSGLSDSEGKSLLRAWEVYAAARRADRLIKETNLDGTSREKNFSQAQIDAVFQEVDAAGHKDLFERVFDDWQEFNNQLLDEAVRIGAMDADMRELWRTNDYVPMYRAMDMLQSDSFHGTRADSAGAQASGGRGISGKKVKSMRLTGSDKKIQGSVFENMMMNTAYLVDTMMKHEAMQRVVDLAEGSYLEKVPYAAQAHKFQGDQLARAMVEAGLIVAPAGHPDPIGYAYGLVKRMTADQKNQWVTLFKRAAPVGKGIVSVMRDGKMAYYQVRDPLLLRSIEAIGHKNFEGMMWKIFRTPKNVLTNMITADPAFMIANFARDTLSAWVTSDAKILPLADSIKGFANAFTEDPLLFQIMMAGAGGGGFYVQEREDLRRLIASRVPGNQVEGFMRSIVKLDGSNSLWSFWQKVGSASENANRLAVARRVLESGGTMAEAAYQAQDLLNFSMRGDFAAVQALVQTVPFMNARIQGLYRLYRGARDNPASFFAKGMVITMASLALLAQNWDDDRYQSLPEWDRDTYWHVFLGDQHFRIPKPFEVGAIFATAPERMFQTMLGDEDAGLFAERIGAMILDTFAMNPTPQVIRPFVEQFFNHDMFTGNALVGMSLEGLPPEGQYNAYTSELMRELAEAMPDWAPPWLRSPKRLEALTEGFFGAMGMYVLSAADELTRGVAGYPERPTLKIWDMPVASRFARDPVPFTNKWQQELYEWTTEANRIARGIKEYQKQGEMQKAQELQQEFLPMLQARPALNRVRTQVSKVNTQIRLISLSDQYSGEDKYQRIQDLKQRKLDLLNSVERYAGIF